MSGDATWALNEADGVRMGGPYTREKVAAALLAAYARGRDDEREACEHPVGLAATVRRIRELTEGAQGRDLSPAEVRRLRADALRLTYFANDLAAPRASSLDSTRDEKPVEIAREDIKRLFLRYRDAQSGSSEMHDRDDILTSILDSLAWSLAPRAANPGDATRDALLKNAVVLAAMDCCEAREEHDAGRLDAEGLERARQAVHAAVNALRAALAPPAASTGDAGGDVRAFVENIASQHTLAERTAKWEAENEGPYEGGDDIEDVYDRVILDARAAVASRGASAPSAGDDAVAAMREAAAIKASQSWRRLDKRYGSPAWNASVEAAAAIRAIPLPIPTTVEAVAWCEETQRLEAICGRAADAIQGVLALCGNGKPWPDGLTKALDDSWRELNENRPEPLPESLKTPPDIHAPRAAQPTPPARDEARDGSTSPFRDSVARHYPPGSGQFNEMLVLSRPIWGDAYRRCVEDAAKVCDAASQKRKNRMFGVSNANAVHVECCIELDACATAIRALVAPPGGADARDVKRSEGRESHADETALSAARTSTDRREGPARAAHRSGTGTVPPEGAVVSPSTTGQEAASGSLDSRNDDGADATPKGQGGAKEEP